MFHARPGTDSARPNGRDNFHPLRGPKIAAPGLMLPPTTVDYRSLSTASLRGDWGRVGASTDLLLRVGVSATSSTIISPKIFGHIAPDVQEWSTPSS